MIFGAVGNLFRGTYTVQVSQAASVYERDGREAASRFLASLDAAFGAEHHLTDSAGRDVTTGDNRLEVLDALRRAGDGPVPLRGRFAYGRASPDGRYWLLVLDDPPFTMRSFAPFYLLIVSAVLLISWLVTIGIASPLRTLASAADRFGRGDLDVRVPYRGRSEIGTLASSFNQMADRIQTLLTAERRLLQDISHELRSPLARLSFAAELARTAPDRQAAIDRLQRDIDRLAGLVGELVEITRAEGDPEARDMRRLALAPLVTDVIDACRLDAEARGCSIVWTGRAEQPVIGNPELLRRAVENVLRNAIRHSPAGAQVQVELAESDASATVSVRDVGPGVPEKDITNVFRPFYRVDESRQTDTGGVGLGLAIVHRAMQLHHGSVAAENAHPGLLVKLTLPVAPEREDA
ncbi:MAG: HAMP domain-containing protein [Acidobacteria bacterium]|nr:HAMP domain-containing protein [Acidobacteriota bacterium]